LLTGADPCIWRGCGTLTGLSFEAAFRIRQAVARWLSAVGALVGGRCLSQTPQPWCTDGAHLCPGSPILGFPLLALGHTVCGPRTLMDWAAGGARAPSDP
jgi:hypothetical protein